MGGLFQREGARSQGVCASARVARAHARTPASYPSEGNSGLSIAYIMCIVFMQKYF